MVLLVEAREVLASMRPGQSCPGVDPPGAGARALIGPASMRPGQSCPGVARSREAGQSPNGICFNEAGAIMPRSGVRTLANYVDQEIALQ